MKIDKVVWQETGYIAAVTAIGSGLMQAVYLIGGWWDYTVLLGNLWGAAWAILNFFLMALAVQRAVEKEPEDASKYMKASGSARMLMLFCAAAVGAAVPFCNTFAVLIPLFFPRIGVFFRTLKKPESDQAEKEGTPDD